MTQLTYDFARTLAKSWRPGDEVIVTRLDHDANIRPWVQAAAAVGAQVRWVDFDPATGELTEDDLEQQLSDRTRLVAVTAASNLIGTRPPLARLAARPTIAALCSTSTESTRRPRADRRHRHRGRPVRLLAVQVPGPALRRAGRAPELLEGLEPDKLAPATDAVPERFELGTLPYELLAGTTAAVDFLASLAGAGEGGRRARVTAAMTAIETHEDDLRRRIERGVAELPGVVVRSRARHRTPTLLLTFEDRAAAEAYRFLAQRGVNAPAGSFYALEASRRLGLGDAGGLRIGLAPYTDASDVERLLAGLAEFLS